MGRRAYSRTLREGLPPRGWVKGTPGISSEAKEFALGGGYGGWLGRGVSRGEDAGPALPRGICEAQQRTEVKVARLCAESGLELPEGRLADPPLLLLLLPLLLLGFQLCLKLAGRGQGLDLRGTAERDPQSESGEEELGHGAPSKQNSSPARDTETWSAVRQGARAKTPSWRSSQVRFLFSRTSSLHLLPCYTCSRPLGPVFPLRVFFRILFSMPTYHPLLPATFNFKMILFSSRKKQ